VSEATSDATSRRATRARHDALVALLREGVASVEALSARVGVSPSTVRRDLGRLEREGRIARTYGGALVRDDFHERSFGESERINQQAKAAIAATAAGMLPAGGTVFLDAGTTCLALARVLVDRGPVTVVTRGLEAALLLSRAPEVTVVLVGGEVRPLSHGVVGPLSSLALDRLAFDVAFLGTDAVDPDRGLGEPTNRETYVKEQAAGRSEAVVLLADGSKLGPARLPAWLPLDPAWTLVTDASAPGDAVDAIRAAGVRVVTAG
jgi:DeoR/GlpR family transcriptional regulator of sugar metabolism